MSDEILIPIEASMKGNNTFVHFCDVVEQARHYCVCLKMLHQAENEGLGERDAICERAIENSNCPAILLRGEELREGKALHYRPRPPYPASEAPDSERTAEADATAYPEDWKKMSELYVGTAKPYRRGESAPPIKSAPLSKPAASAVTKPRARPSVGVRRSSTPTVMSPDFAAAVNHLIKKEAAK